MKKLHFDTPARYRIRVQGRIDPIWSDRLEGMIITYPAPNDEQLVTRLEGELLDQASLAGVLNTLYELHLPVLSVMYLAPEVADNKADSISTAGGADGLK